jgi:hypothetical protein
VSLGARKDEGLVTIVKPPHPVRWRTVIVLDLCDHADSIVNAGVEPLEDESIADLRFMVIPLSVQKLFAATVRVRCDSIRRSVWTTVDPVAGATARQPGAALTSAGRTCNVALGGAAAAGPLVPLTDPGRHRTWRHGRHLGGADRG